MSPTAAKTRRRGWRFWAARVFGALFALVIVYESSFAVRLWWWQSRNPSITAFMESRLETIRLKQADARLKQAWVPYAKISVHLKRAVLIAEDDKFVDHDGFDWQGIQRAIEKNQRKGKVVAGGSTISQQLAKNLFLSDERSFVRKGQEAVITIMMESLWDKERILEVYLNVIEWGNGVFGAEAAARHYFGVAASQLNPEQAARLAAMVPRPRFYDRNRNSAYLAQRTQSILSRLHQAQLP